MADVLFPPAARSFLEEVRFAILATINRDGRPQQSVMWYEIQGDTIMMNTAADRLKASNLRRDPRVSVCVAEGYRYVTLTGRAELDDDQTVAQADIARLAHRYGKDTPDSLATFRRQHRVTIRLPIAHAHVAGF